MKRIATTFSFLILLLLMSCGECEDKTLEVSAELMEFFPYDNTTEINMINGTNETINYSIIQENDISIRDDRDCFNTFVKPTIKLSTTTQEEVIKIWGSLNEDLLLGDHEQLWFIIDDDTGSIDRSGSVRFPLMNLRTVQLNGRTFDEVISTEGAASRERLVIYLQRNMGIVGYEYQGETDDVFSSLSNKLT